MPYYQQVFGDTQVDWAVLTSILQPRVVRLTDIPGMKELPEYDKELFINKKSKANLDNAPVMLKAAIEALTALPEWNVTAIHDRLMELAKELEVKTAPCCGRCALPLPVCR